MKNRFMLGMAIFVIIFLVGCKPEKINSSSDPLQNIRRSLLATIERPNTPVPEFTLKDINGNVIKNTDLKNKPYIIQGFTFGCASCAKEVATLNKVYNEYKDKGLEIISVDISGEDNEGVMETKERFNGGDWIWALDTDNVGVKFGMKSLESTYLINKNGNIIYVDHILTDPEILSEEIKKII